MKEINVKNLKHFGVVALMFVIGLLAIASNAAVWNAVAGGGGLLWFFGKKVLPTVK